MKTSIRSRDFEDLKFKLEALDVTIFEGRSGGFTAFTTAEPLFCFERNSLSEIDDLIRDTLRSYVSGFFEVEHVSVSTSEIPLPEVIVPVEELKPLSRRRINLADNLTGERQLACA